MPSLTHQALVELFRARPELAAQLLQAGCGAAVPAHGEAVATHTPLDQLVPTERRADLVIELRDRPDGGIVAAIVLEVQLGVDEDKPYTWPLYVAALRARWRVPVWLLVLVLDDAVGQWAATPLVLAPGMGQFLPQVLGPQGLPPITDPVVARKNPELTVLSAVALAGTEAASAIVEALPAAIPGLDPSLIPGYLGMVFAALPQALRARLEALMRQPIFADVKLPPSIQAVLDAGRAEGRTEGRTEGEARGELHGRAASILAILEARAIPVPADVRDEILACTDLPTLERWLRRAATLKRARAVVRPPRAVGA